MIRGGSRAWKIIGARGVPTGCGSRRRRWRWWSGSGSCGKTTRGGGRTSLAVLLRREGITLSASTIGRVLGRLKAREVLHEARLGRRKSRWRPGDLVQVDTLDVLVVANLRRNQFTARDVISRYDVVEVYGVATAHTARAFLDVLVRRAPFPIRALQIDGGSEFRGAFEAACAAMGIRVFVIPPRSPKLQSHVERAQRTHREEFYEVWPVQADLTEHRTHLQAWAQIYNTVRPHQHLNYRTPFEVCQEYTTARG